MRNPAHSAIFVGLFLVGAMSFNPTTSAQSKNIREDVDPYSGLHTLFLEVPTRTCPDDPGLHEHDPDVHLLFSANENPDGTVYYFLTPTLDRGYTLNTRPNDTMDTLIDGLPGSFTTPLGSTVVTQYSGGRSYLHETLTGSSSASTVPRGSFSAASTPSTSAISPSFSPPHPSTGRLKPAPRNKLRRQ
jgi:hypothetical protein